MADEYSAIYSNDEADIASEEYTDEVYSPAPLDEDKTAQLLSASGPLAAMNKAFEERAGQIDLVRHIVRAFNTNSIGVFEAGTGVGKSYAYLIPAILWAMQNNERVVISTGTINLQQQLCNKDIPAALRIAGNGKDGKKIKAVLLKGRNNFVCLRRIADAEANVALLDDDSKDELDKIIKWTHDPKNETGSRSELPFMPSCDVWSRVRSESEACLGKRCPFRSSCFVAKARAQAREAHIIVVNHHLLFADIESRLSGVSFDNDAVLPSYHTLVIDEAHCIEDSATSFFSSKVNRYSLSRAISVLYRKRGKQIRGCLLQLSSAATEEDVRKIRFAANAVHDAIDDLNVAGLAVTNQHSSVRVYSETQAALKEVLKKTTEAAEAIAEFVAVAKKILKAATDEEKTEAPYLEAHMNTTHLSDTASLLGEFAEYSEHKESIYYIEARGKGARRYVTFCRTPLDMAPKMSRGLFEPLASVVCTSATLSVGGDMGYWMRRSGAALSEGDRLLTAQFPSPFPYQTHCLFAVPTDAPSPTDKMNYPRYTASAIAQLIVASNGRALVLFTSYEALLAAAGAVRPVVQPMGINILCQGEDDNARLLAAFKGDEYSQSSGEKDCRIGYGATQVLFATSSFWQGVDVAGEALSLVIIVRLPFTVPDDPVFTARAEALEEAGGNAFMQMSVPEAVIKFRQGFGRLIRTNNDRGAVIVLDRRIITSRYGSIFTSSVPHTHRLTAPIKQIAQQVAKFLLSTTE